MKEMELICTKEMEFAFNLLTNEFLNEIDQVGGKKIIYNLLTEDFVYENDAYTEITEENSSIFIGIEITSEMEYPKEGEFLPDFYFVSQIFPYKDESEETFDESMLRTDLIDKFKSEGNTFDELKELLLKSVISALSYRDQFCANHLKHIIETMDFHEIAEKALNCLNEEFSCTSYGEPEYWITIDPILKRILFHDNEENKINNDHYRSIEIVEEQDGLNEEDFYYSMRIHCSEKDSDKYESTMGVIDTYCTDKKEFDNFKSTLKDAIINAFTK